MTEELTTTTVYFAWESVMPDKRQYKQNGTVLKLYNTLVAVTVPLTPEYIFNYADVIQIELNPAMLDLVKPQLTPKGMRYCIDRLEEVMGEPTLLEKAKEDDWDEKIKAGNTVSTPPVDDWNDGAQFDEGNAGKADNELWEGNEEDWK